MKNLKRYFLEIVILAILLFGGYKAFMFFYPELPKPGYDYFIFAAVVLITTGSHLLANLSMSVSGKPFVQAAILSFVLRLIIYIVLSFVIIALDVENSIPNIALLGYFYLAFTIHEIVTLVKK